MNDRTLHLPQGFLPALRLALTLFAVPVLAQTPACSRSVGHMDVSRGDYSPQPGVTFDLRHFSATLVPQGRSAPLCFQKLTVVSHAVIFASNASLTQVFAQKLTQSGSKIRDLQVIHSPDGVTIKGIITKIIPVHFSIFGPVTTDGTVISMHAEKIDADGIPIKALLAMLGEHLSAVLGMKGVTGVSVEENTMSFSPEQVAHLKGHLQSVTTSAAGLTLTYAPILRHAGGVTRAAK